MTLSRTAITPHRYWTDDEIARLRKLAKKGFSITQASRVLGRTCHSIGTKASKCEIHFHGKARGYSA